MAGDAVLGEVVGIEQAGLSKGVGEDTPVEAVVGAFGEMENGFAGVPAGLERGVDVDEVTGERPPVECAHLVRDRVVGVQNRSDGHEDGFVGAPVHAEFDLGCVPAVGDCQPGERVVLPFDVDGEAVVAVGADDGGDRGGELVAAVPGGEQVDVLAGPLKKSGRLYRVTAGEGEAVSVGGCQPSAGEPFVERVHGLRGVRASGCEFGEAFFPAPP